MAPGTVELGTHRNPLRGQARETLPAPFYGVLFQDGHATPAALGFIFGVDFCDKVLLRGPLGANACAGNERHFESCLPRPEVRLLWKVVHTGEFFLGHILARATAKSGLGFS